jgi:hypothetical protein
MMWEGNTGFSYRGSGSTDKSRKQFSLANLDMVMQYTCHGNDTFGDTLITNISTQKWCGWNYYKSYQSGGMPLTDWSIKENRANNGLTFQSN